MSQVIKKLVKINDLIGEYYPNHSQLIPIELDEELKWLRLKRNTVF